MRILWNEIIAFVFFLLAVPPLLQGFNVLRNFDGSSDHVFRLILTGLFGLVMIGFGVSSYLRARRLSRS